MRAYELMFIVDGDLDDTTVEVSVRRVSEQVAAKGGEIKSTDRWGKRRFAYEIDKKHDGYYVVLELVSEGTGLDELERQLRLADDIVRHKLIRLPDKEAAKRGLVGTQAPA
jgi:small subunit ribosomal protein S6